MTTPRTSSAPSLTTADYPRGVDGTYRTSYWLIVALVCTGILAFRLPLLQDVGAKHTWSRTSCLLAFPLHVLESRQDYGSLGCNHSISRDPLRLGGKLYSTGIATHANASIRFEPIPVALSGEHFSGRVGLSDHVVYVGGSAVASIRINGVEQWRSRRLVAGVVDSFSVAVSPGNVIELVVSDANDGIRSDEVAWIDLQIH